MNIAGMLSALNQTLSPAAARGGTPSSSTSNSASSNGSSGGRVPVSSSASRSVSSGGTATGSLQLLLDTARALMAQGRTLSLEEVETMKHIMAAVPLDELGLHPPEQQVWYESEQAARGRLAQLASSKAKRPPITYLHVYEDAEVSIGVFCLPAAATIPLHNHPGMTVLSRVLYGQMYVQSFDFIDGGGGEPGAARGAQLVVNSVQAPGADPLALYPHGGGNIHAFTALTDCAVLDVLTPPYSPREGRDCSYYYVAGPLPGGARGAVELREFEPPPDFVVKRGKYCGINLRAAPAGEPGLLRKLGSLCNEWQANGGDGQA